MQQLLPKGVPFTTPPHSPQHCRISLLDGYGQPLQKVLLASWFSCHLMETLPNVIHLALCACTAWKLRYSVMCYIVRLACHFCSFIGVHTCVLSAMSLKPLLHGLINNPGQIQIRPRYGANRSRSNTISFHMRTFNLTIGQCTSIQPCYQCS